MGKNIGKNISKNFGCRYNQKPLDNAKKSATDALKNSSKRAIQKKAETTGDLISNKIADEVVKPYGGRITKFSKNSEQNNSETVTNERDKEIPKERYTSPEERQKNIDNLRSVIIV